VVGRLSEIALPGQAVASDFIERGIGRLRPRQGKQNGRDAEILLRRIRAGIAVAIRLQNLADRDILSRAGNGYIRKWTGFASAIRTGGIGDHESIRNVTRRAQTHQVLIQPGITIDQIDGSESSVAIITEDIAFRG